jgi:hypothetical protein
MMRVWPSHFFSTPYMRWFDRKEWTCWHLVLDFYDREFGIKLPRYGVDDYPNIAIGREFANAKGSGLWTAVDQPTFGDVATFWEVHPAFDNHVAVMVAPSRMMHVQLDNFTTIVRYDSPVWGNRRTGLFRHRELL